MTLRLIYARTRLLGALNVAKACNELLFSLGIKPELGVYYMVEGYRP